MKAIRADYPAEWPKLRIYPLADLHIGDPHCMMHEVRRRIKIIMNDPYGITILNGDLLNAATRNSVSDVYGDPLNPGQQADTLISILRPLAQAGKIAASDMGNHEARIYKESGIDIMAMVCESLGIRDRYNAESVMIFLRFGRRNGHGRHIHKNQAQWYSLFATHGSGGGAGRAATVSKLDKMSHRICADVYLHSHTHYPISFDGKMYRMNASNCSIQEIKPLYVNTDSTLAYGGYAEQGEYNPAPHAFLCIELDAEHKGMRCFSV